MVVVFHKAMDKRGEIPRARPESRKFIVYQSNLRGIKVRDQYISLLRVIMHRHEVTIVKVLSKFAYKGQQVLA